MSKLKEAHITAKLKLSNALKKIAIQAIRALPKDVPPSWVKRTKKASKRLEKVEEASPDTSMPTGFIF